MKKLFASVCICLSLAGPVLLLAPITGCKSPLTVSYQSISSVDATVDSSLKAWARYVVFEQRRIVTLPTVPEQTDATAVLQGKRKQVSDSLDAYTKVATAAVNGLLVAQANNTNPASVDTITTAAAFNTLVVQLSK